VSPQHPPGTGAELPANVSDLLRSAATRYPDRPAVITAESVRSWSELDRAADAGATALLQAGHRAGERVLVILPTGEDLLLTLFALARAGLVAVPIGPDRSDPAAVAAEVDAARVIGAQVAGRPDLPDVAGWWSATAEPVVPSTGGEDLAILARAGAGRPVMLSHRALLAAVDGIVSAPAVRLRTEDRALQVLPLFHLAGWVTGFLPLATAGAAVVLPRLPEPNEPGWAAAVLAVAREQRVSVVPAAPGLYRRLADQPGVERSLASVRLLTSGAAPLDPADWSALRNRTGLAVWEGYGISESAGVVATSLMGRAPRPGSVGRPVAGVQLRILVEDEPASDAQPDEAAEPPADDVGQAEQTEQAGHVDEEPVGAPEPDAGTDAETGRDADAEAEAGTDPGEPVEPAQPVQPIERLAEVAADGEVGRIEISGPTLFSGYWPDGEGAPEPGGWWRTGDIGFLDDQGDLHVVDRAEEALLVAGFTVYPREIEDVLVRHPYVRDAAVVPAAGRVGQEIVAVLVPEPGTHPTAGDLDDYLAARLPAFKRPARYQLVGELHRTALGRLDRERVRADVPDRAAAALREVAPEAPDRTPAEKAPLLPGVEPGSARAAQDSEDDLF
jgi:long-chain acyl-CoA synthetase